MARTFNCGIGAILIVQKELAGKVLSDFRRHEEAWLIGKVVHHQAGMLNLNFLRITCINIEVLIYLTIKYNI